MAVIRVVLVSAVAGLALAGCGATPAPAPAETAWQEPYGGCKEAADYPGTPGWKDCRDHGLLPR